MTDDRLIASIDPALKDRWVQALRSGDYTQGRGFLRQGDLFCCLGVLCDLMGVEWEEVDAPTYRAVWTDPDTGVTQRGVETLPTILAAKLGVESVVRVALEDGEVTSLTALNDGGSSFAEIADVIEEWL